MERWVVKPGCIVFAGRVKSATVPGWRGIDVVGQSLVDEVDDLTDQTLFVVGVPKVEARSSLVHNNTLLVLTRLGTLRWTWSYYVKVVH